MKPKSENKLRELLRKWLSGEARAEEERQLEQLAEDDPFLADTLEGFREFPEDNHTGNVYRLKTKIRERSQQKRRRTFPYWMPRVAAAVVLLVLAIGGFWLLNEDVLREQPIVQTEEPQPAGKRASDLAEEEADQKITPGESEQARPESGAAPSEEAEAPIAEEEIPEDAQPAADELVDAELPDAPAEEEKDEDLKPASIDPRPVEGIATQQSKEANKPLTATPDYAPKISAPESLEAKSYAISQSKFLHGTVTGPQGEPLMGANIQVPGTDQETVSDFDGHFRLNLDSQYQKLVVSYTGLKTRTVPITYNTDSLKIELSNENTPQGELTFETFSRSMRALQQQPNTQPKGGFEELEKYIKKEMYLHETAKQQNTEEKVKLQFTVHADGHLSDFKVLQSLCKSCDKEAIRLLREGPEWEILTNQKTVRTEYTIRFPSN